MLVVFLSSGVWGVVADRLGRRWSMIIPAVIAIAVTPLYLLSTDMTWIVLGFVVQGAFGGGIYGQNPSYLSERFPTEVRATASAFCYHQGAIWGGFTAPVLVYCAGASRREPGNPDADRDRRRIDQLCSRRAVRPGDQGQDPRSRPCRFLTEATGVAAFQDQLMQTNGTLGDAPPVDRLATRGGVKGCKDQVP